MVDVYNVYFNLNPGLCPSLCFSFYLVVTITSLSCFPAVIRPPDESGVHADLHGGQTGIGPTRGQDQGPRVTPGAGAHLPTPCRGECHTTIITNLDIFS